MEIIYSKELGLTVLPGTRNVAVDSFSLTDALALYHPLKGGGKTKLFFESSERSMRYLKDFLGHDDLAAIEISDAGRFRDYLFDRGMSSSSMKRVFSSVRTVIISQSENRAYPSITCSAAHSFRTMKPKRNAHPFQLMQWSLFNKNVCNRMMNQDSRK